MKSTDSSDDLDIKFLDGYIFIPGGFSGSYSKSQNGQYIITWKDGHYAAEESNTDEETDPEEMERDLKFYRRVIEEGGNPEWKERFLKAVEDRIYKEKYDDWRIAFYDVIKSEIPEGGWDKWYDRFTDAMIKNMDKAGDEAIKKIDAMSQDEFEASYKKNIEELDEDNDDDVKSYVWQKGEVVLLQGKKIIFDERFDRPFHGKVANNGTIIIEDVMLVNGSGIMFFAYNNSQKKIIQHHFTAGIKTFAISDDGQYAICQLCHSETIDRSTMALFDLESGKLLWQRIPETWVADSFQFDIEGKAIYLIYENGEKYKYSMTGEFLDKDKRNQHLLKHGTGSQLMEIADKIIPSGNIRADENQINEALNLYNIAAERLKPYPYFLAQAYRKIGEIYENLGKTVETIKYYELALKYNPNIGVKKKLKSLKTK
jgi:hypothetical protein